MTDNAIKDQLFEYGSANVRFICDLYVGSLEKWGKLFDFGRGQANSYANKKAIVPQVAAIKICEHYGIDLGKFYTQYLTKDDIGSYNGSGSIVEEERESYGVTVDIPEDGLTQKEATALYERLRKAEKKVEILLEALSKLS